ncbi:MAG TPA: GNAT family N-acetyltransferase [Acetobacteraceae bacterium]|nr:GNAT family N-acetyltransferase [Acetobacteraceae bacterium]
MIQAHPGHAMVMAAIHASAFAGGEAWDTGAFARQLELPGVFGFLHPGAGLVLARFAAGEAEILTLAVAPPARRQGVGLALLRAVIAEAAARGGATLFLEVSVRNEAARFLYEAAGFRLAGRRRAYYADGSDALVLALPLSRAAAAGG